jgi:NADPH-dependent curcumin reductase
LPKAEDWKSVVEPVPAPGDGQVVVEVTHISLDPAMRGWMNEGPSYIDPIDLGDVMRALGAGRVIASRSDALPEGSWVTGFLGVQQYAVCDTEDLHRIDPERAPVARYLGALGMTGLTAYFGMTEIGKPQEGDTVLVSGAAGAVGSVAAQIAKLEGCRTIGIAGGAEKCRWLTDELGLDAAIDYKNQSIDEELPRLAPDGVDVYFDNVGGEMLDSVLPQLAVGARVVYCGAISVYNSTEPWGPKNFRYLIVNRASITGMIVFDFEERYPEAEEQLATWLDQGLIEPQEQIVTGTVEDFPTVLMQLFSGANLGKLVLEISK